MKTHVEYECEICRRRYREEESALECEARGIPDGFPIGVMFGDHRKGAFYSGITFATATNFIREHCNYPGLWACRDNMHGDSLGEETCGGSNGYSRGDELHEDNGHLDPNHPTFTRMAKWLTGHGIVPMVWDGKRIVSLAEYTATAEAK